MNGAGNPAIARTRFGGRLTVRTPHLYGAHPFSKRVAGHSSGTFLVLFIGGALIG